MKILDIKVKTIYLYICSLCICYSNSENISKEENLNIKLFNKLYQTKRIEQQEAVKSLMKYDYAKQFKLIDTIASKAFQILEESQVKLREAGYVPGMDFPTEDGILQAFSLCLENTAFLCEILLHLPDITHRLLQKQKSWSLIFTWGIFFASQSNFLDEKTKKLVYLASQELEIAEKDSNYVNPYVKKKKSASSQESSPAKKPKKKKTFKKGPMLSRQSGDL